MDAKELGGKLDLVLQRLDKIEKELQGVKENTNKIPHMERDVQFFRKVMESQIGAYNNLKILKKDDEDEQM